MKPYYEEDGITIYHGDFREVLPGLRFDAIVTDPPYGIGASGGTGEYGKRKFLAGDTKWDDSAPDLSDLLSVDCPKIIWGGNYFALPPSRCYLVWDKGAGFKGRDFAECEMAWCSLDANARVFSYDPLAGGDYRDKKHPTQKPISLMKWCLSILPAPVDSIADPFMGSGSTLRAAKDMGRKAYGIELEEKYCEIAAKRLSQRVLEFA